MNFIFGWKNNILLTRDLCFYQEKIKFISLSRRVMFKVTDEKILNITSTN